MNNDQPISRIVERLFSECLPPSFKPFVDRAQAEKILAPLFEAEFAERTSLIGRSNQLVLELSRVRGLLQRHGRHDEGCGQHPATYTKRACNCGLDEALAATSKGEPSAETGGEKADV